MIEFDLKSGASSPGVTLKVLGVGGAGNNMVNSMIASQFEGIEFIVANTDAQALKASHAQHKIQLGAKATKGLGCGASPDLGRRSAEEDLDKIVQMAEGADVLFLVAGMGGGTGSGALPVISHALKNADILTIAIVTKPFSFEGKRRMRVAQEAIEILQADVDTLLVVPNQKLLEIVDSSASMLDAFEMINELLGQSVKSIADIISKPGLINVDFADLRTVMKDRGKAVMSTGRASGNDRATQAATRAISSPLLENMSIEGARGVLLNVAGDASLGIHEISAAASLIHEAVHEDANIILGSVIDEKLGDDIVVTVIATGFDLPHAKLEHKTMEPAVREATAATDRVIEKNSVEQKKSAIHLQDTHMSTSETMMQEKTQKNKEEPIVQSRTSIEFDPKDLDAPTYLRKAKEKTIE